MVDFAVYRRTPENIARLAAALAPLRPYLRGAPAWADAEVGPYT